jgi:Protein of unknown function (DUF3341)
MKGMLAGFESEQRLRLALQRLAAAQFEHVETYTPAPPDAELEPTGSPLPLLMFVAGMLGFIGFFLLMTYADVRAYALDIGGRPDFAWPAFVPISFELGVLCAMSAGFLGYFVLCRMPQLHDPVDECESFRAASRDRWFVAVRSGAPQRLAQARTALEALQPSSIEEFCA